MRNIARFNVIMLLLVVFGGFLIFGFSENIKGPAIPAMQRDFGLNEAQLGLLLSLNSLGYLLACAFTSSLSNRIGIRLTGILSFASMAASGVRVSPQKARGAVKRRARAFDREMGI